MALLELVRVLDEDPRVGAVGGDVRILNPLDSWVSFLSSLRYWVAFNVERACQSYFHCVSCISGPLQRARQGACHLQEDRLKPCLNFLSGFFTFCCLKSPATWVPIKNPEGQRS